MSNPYDDLIAQIDAEIAAKTSELKNYPDEEDLATGRMVENPTRKLLLTEIASLRKDRFEAVKNKIDYKEPTDLDVRAKNADVGLKEAQLQRYLQGSQGEGPRWKPGEQAMAERGLGLEEARGEETVRHNAASEFLQSLATAVSQGNLDEQVAQNKFLSYLALRKQALDEYGAGVQAFGEYAKLAVPPGMTTYPGTQPGGQISRVTGGPPMQINPQQVDIDQQLGQALANTPMPLPR